MKQFLEEFSSVTPENSHKMDGLENKSACGGLLFLLVWGGVYYLEVFFLGGVEGEIILQVIKILIKQHLHFSSSLWSGLFLLVSCNLY